MPTTDKTNTGLPPIKACLFDMDGLLIDSEDLYTKCTNEILHKYGKPSLPWSVKARLQGRPGPEAGAIFADWAQLPISQEQFLDETRVLQTKYFPETKPLPGAEVLLQRLKEANIEIALATSSNSRNFAIKTAHLGPFFSVFDELKIVKGDDPRMKPGRGKPAPDIFFLALQTINDSLKSSGQPEIYPEECLVFEDSVPGVEAGRRAGMQVCWCPHEGLLGEYNGREAQVLAGLTGEHKDDGTNDDAASERTRDEDVKAGRVHARVRGQAGEIGDKWSLFYASLDNFPLVNYGIV